MHACPNQRNVRYVSTSQLTWRHSLFIHSKTCQLTVKSVACSEYLLRHLHMPYVHCWHFLKFPNVSPPQSNSRRFGTKQALNDRKKSQHDAGSLFYRLSLTIIGTVPKTWEVRQSAGTLRSLPRRKWTFAWHVVRWVSEKESERRMEAAVVLSCRHTPYPYACAL